MTRGLQRISKENDFFETRTTDFEELSTRGKEHGRVIDMFQDFH